MQLTQLIDRIQPLAVSGEVVGRGVSCVVFDSRQSVPGCLFVAVKGTQVDGHDYIQKAISLGATTVVCERVLGEDAGAEEVLKSNETPSPTPPHGGGASWENASAFYGQGLASGVGKPTKDYWNVTFNEGNAILELAKLLRKNATPAEKTLWEELRANRTGHHFHRQKPMGRSIVDFVCLNKRVVVEVDGGYHENEEMLWSDEQRDRKFLEAGYVTLRYTNEEVLAAPNKVSAEITEVLSRREERNEKYPNEIFVPYIDNPEAPLPRGEGLGGGGGYLGESRKLRRSPGPNRRRIPQ